MSAILARRLGSLALAATLGLGLGSCSNTYTVPRPTYTGVAIQSLKGNPTSVANKDGAITFTVSATDTGKKAVTYTWSASRGTLSATTGSKVVWYPRTAAGTQETAGFAQVKVEASNGTDTHTDSVLVRILSSGGAEIAAAGLFPETEAPSPAPSVGVTSGSGSAGSGASGNAVACQVDKVAPSWAAPGTLFTISGKGLAAPATVKVGDQEAQVLDIQSDRIIAKLPAGMAFSNEALAVSVTACGETHVLKSALTVADTTTFGGNVTQAGQGLLASVIALEPNTDQWATDVSTKEPEGTFYASHFDVVPTMLSAGFPGKQGALDAWFAIRFTGQLEVKQAGLTSFSLQAADGAKLYIDDQVVIDGDEIRAGQSADGDVELKAGKHNFRLDYYKGQRSQVELQLYWTQASGGREEIVPASAFSLLK